VSRFREAVEIVDSLLRNETTTYAGEHYQLQDALFRPQPLQRPRPPLTLGAHGRRMMKIVAQYADACNSFGTVEEMRQRNAILDEQCAAVGRDPADIWRGLYGWAALMPSDPWQSVDAFADMVGRYREAGVNEFIIDQPAAAQLSMAERIATDLLPQLRATAAS
jgi:alkanesulfonate monooxygenase SsuD/methylene tetrahydromethanopterin reductase-like flavin-dependent oxidoreductase (luciferase family)